MNIVKFESEKGFEEKIIFCMVDDFSSYLNNWTKQIVTNIADFTISNLRSKNFNVYVGFNEDQLLKHAAKNYSYAVVISPGTEFIDGDKFFTQLKLLLHTNFFIAGHILDRGDAYYELHKQCYIINLDILKKLGFPPIGAQELGLSHEQVEPIRSKDNFHNDHTPHWIKSGKLRRKYSHKLHGWNILSVALNQLLPIIVFDNSLRENKKHHYPESQKDFDQNLSWIYYRNKFCAEKFIHHKHTEDKSDIEGHFDQLIIPASGDNFHDQINCGQVIFFDYNQSSLNYWASTINKKKDVQYIFLHLDLLTDHNLLDYINYNANNTLINFTNIFCYEGTMSLYPLRHRLQKENEILSQLKANFRGRCVVSFSMRAACGFYHDLANTIELNEFEQLPVDSLIKPTWHFNSDWQ